MPISCMNSGLAASSTSAAGHSRAVPFSCTDSDLAAEPADGSRPSTRASDCDSEDEGRDGVSDMLADMDSFAADNIANEDETTRAFTREFVSDLSRKQLDALVMDGIEHPGDRIMYRLSDIFVA